MTCGEIALGTRTPREGVRGIGHPAEETKCSDSEEFKACAQTVLRKWLLS